MDRSNDEEKEERRMKRLIKIMKKLNKARRKAGLSGYFIIKKGQLRFLDDNTDDNEENKDE